MLQPKVCNTTALPPELSPLRLIIHIVLICGIKTKVLELLSMDTLVIRFMPHHVLSGLRTDPGPAVARQRGDWDRRPDAVCAQRRRTCPVPGAAATPQAQHPEGGCMDHLQHHGRQPSTDPGGTPPFVINHPVSRSDPGTILSTHKIYHSEVVISTSSLYVVPTHLSLCAKLM